MKIREFLGKQISEIDYLKCQYKQEPVSETEDGKRLFKVWALTENQTHPEQPYYYLNVISDDNNIISQHIRED